MLVIKSAAYMKMMHSKTRSTGNLVSEDFFCRNYRKLSKISVGKISVGNTEGGPIEKKITCLSRVGD